MKTEERKSRLDAGKGLPGSTVRTMLGLHLCLLAILSVYDAGQAAIICDGLGSPATVRANPASATETGNTAAGFVFEIIGPPASGTHLTLQISGTASNGVDYETISTQVGLPGGLGEKRATLLVVPIADAIVEGTETVTVKIVSSDNVCVYVGSPNEATVYITEDPESSLSTALDNTNLTWTTGGSSLWAPQTVTTHDGVDAAQSGAASHGLDSWLETTVTGPGSLSFWWRVSSEQNFDWLRFHIDGFLQHQISGEVNWQQRTYSIPEGPHTLRWRYAKDLYDFAGQDTAWVDDVRFTPSSGTPVVAIQPANQKVWPGANVGLHVVALGQPPLSHQWYFNGKPIPGATEPELAIRNIRSRDAGEYQVIVINDLGLGTSSKATITVTNNGPATSALLYVDGPFPSPYETALTRLGHPFQKFTSAASFNSAVSAANRNNTLVVVDATYYTYDLAGVRSFIITGGRALVQAYSLIADAPLAYLLQVSLERRFTVPSPIHDWSGSLFFYGLDNPLDFTDNKFIENGVTFHVLTGGFSVAGFGTAAQPGEAAVVIGNGGRTIVNGFFLEDIASAEDAVRFAQNQIEFLTDPMLPIELLSPTWGDGQFSLELSGGRAGLGCAIETSQDLKLWSVLTNVILSSGPTPVAIPAPAPSSAYRALLSPMP